MKDKNLQSAHETTSLLVKLCLSSDKNSIELPSPPCWNAITSEAMNHGLAPLFYHRLQKLGLWSQLPKETQETLKYAFAANLRRTELQRRELVTITKALAEESIPVIPYKGCFLSQLLYGDPYLRMSVDIDLIIPKRDVKKAWEILTGKMKYKALAPEKGFVDPFQTNEYHFVFGKNLNQSTHQIELHWGLVRTYTSFTPPMERIWSTVEQIPIWNTIFYIPPKPIYFLMLAHHAFCDSWPLKHIIDLALFFSLLTSSEKEILRTEAETWGTSLLLQETLNKVKTLTQSVFLPYEGLNKTDQSRKEHGINILKENFFLAKTRKSQIKLFLHMMLKPSFRDYDMVPEKLKTRALATLVRPYRLFKEWFLK